MECGFISGFVAGRGSRGYAQETCNTHTARRTAIVARAQNAGGYRLPPKVPDQKVLLTRAHELLGNRTQRQLKASAESELENLIGTVPKTKRAAQKYKAALELKMKQEYRVENGFLLATPLTRTKYMDIIRMPESERDISRCFSMLQAIRRDGVLSEKSSNELQALLGLVPRDAQEARRASNALKRLVRERFRMERIPPRLPESDDELTAAYMLIGVFVEKGTAGRGNEEIRRLLGDVPRTVTIARYWKKFIALHIRKYKRSALVKSRKAMADVIRQQRKEKREARLASESDLALIAMDEGVSNPQITSRMRLVMILTSALAIGVVGGPAVVNITATRLRSS